MRSAGCSGAEVIQGGAEPDPGVIIGGAWAYAGGVGMVVVLGFGEAGGLKALWLACKASG